MVNNMRLSELQNKDVVDMNSGEKIGNVIDAEISSDTGNILKLYVFEKKGFSRMLKNNDEQSVSWHQIKKIGADVILVAKKL